MATAKEARYSQHRLFLIVWQGEDVSFCRRWVCAKFTSAWEITKSGDIVWSFLVPLWEHSDQIPPSRVAFNWLRVWAQSLSPLLPMSLQPFWVNSAWSDLLFLSNFFCTEHKDTVFICCRLKQSQVQEQKLFVQRRNKAQMGLNYSSY